MSRQPSMNSWRGYLAASLGGATGAVVLTAICLFLAYPMAFTRGINAAFWLLVGLTSITLPLLARFLAR